MTQQEHIQDAWQHGRLGVAGFEAMTTIYGDARSRVARLLNAGSDEIALTDSPGGTAKRVLKRGR